MITTCKKCLISTSNDFQPCNRSGDRGHILWIGEAPGTTENRLKIPFTGKAGLKLKEFTGYYHLDQFSVFTNVIKCQPPRNRDPHTDEILKCKPYLLDDINVVDPKLIILLGRIALESFKGTSIEIIKPFINKPFVIAKTIVISIYHPSYILRNDLDHLYFESFNIISDVYNTINIYYRKRNFKKS
jgi:DNA polymerase